MRLERLRKLLDAARRHDTVGETDIALILTYTLMDVMGAITRPVGKSRNDSADFRAWLDRFVLPKARLSCTSGDLWAARCGILHSLDEQSDLSRSGKAKVIGHVAGEEYAGNGLRYDDIFQAALKIVPQVATIPPGQLIFVHLTTLIDEIESGIGRTELELKSDPALAALASDRLRKGMPLIVSHE